MTDLPDCSCPGCAALGEAIDAAALARRHVAQAAEQADVAHGIASKREWLASRRWERVYDRGEAPVETFPATAQDPSTPRLTPGRAPAADSPGKRFPAGRRLDR